MAQKYRVSKPFTLNILLSRVPQSVFETAATVRSILLPKPNWQTIRNLRGCIKDDVKCSQTAKQPNSHSFEDMRCRTRADGTVGKVLTYGVVGAPK